MNNKIFIATSVKDNAVLNVVRYSIEKDSFFDRYAADLAVRKGYYGFVTVTPKSNGNKMCSLWRMLRCSFVYFPCGWHEDKCCRNAMILADLLGKKKIFEEDSRCK